MSIKYKGIHHLAMATNDMDATIAFWRDLLEMRLIAGLGRPGYRQYFFEISDYDMIAFFEWPNVQKIEPKDHGVPVNKPFAFDHIAFGLENEDMLWQIKDRLEAADIWVSEIIDHGFIHSIYTFDPNEIPIEFTVVVKSIDIHRSPVMADKTPCQNARQGAEPRSEKWPQVKHPTPEDQRILYPGEGLILTTKG